MTDSRAIGLPRRQHCQAWVEQPQSLLVPSGLILCSPATVCLVWSFRADGLFLKIMIVNLSQALITPR